MILNILINLIEKETSKISNDKVPINYLMLFI